MTRNQQAVLDFVRATIETTGGSPTYEEIRQAVGLSSKSRVQPIIEALIAEGHLYRRAARHRGLALSAQNLSNVPTQDLEAELHRRSRGGDA